MRLPLPKTFHSMPNLSILTNLSGLLPPSPHSVLFCLLLNRLLQNQHADFSPLQGKSLCLHSQDIKLSLFLGSNQKKLIPLGFRNDATLTISANLRDFIRLALRQEDPDTLFFSRRLSMEGDTELGLWFKNLLDTIDPGQLMALRNR
jgi:predicted lipid carrier protein YhbT